ncbi:MAG TPA: hypothetical protein VFW20_02645, partial [Candidatus Limnocylindrales bacterium]|nr:hypothetical protein [Candidatus Limnocylindrales bacterium]
MHPDPPQADISRDPILDGRDSLRLVKLRLALALITVAIMPIAAVSPLVRAAAEEARLAHHQRLESEAAQVTTSFQRELSAIETTATSLISDPDVLASVGSGANGATRAKASAQLGNLMRRDSGAVTGVTLRDATGVKAAYGAPLDPTILPAGDPVAGIVTTSDSGPEASSLVLVTVPDGGRGSLEIVTVMSMQALLSYSAPSRVPGQTIGLFDDQGATIATFHSAFDPSSLPGQVLDLAT